MATDAIATEEVSNQRDSSDMNANKSINPESDTPNWTSETQENRNRSSPTSLLLSSSSSSVYSGDELPEDSITANSLANGNSGIRAGDPPQEAASSDNRQKQGVRTSTPVHTLSSPAEHNGRYF